MNDLTPIGIIRSPFTSKDECPIQPVHSNDAEGKVVLFEEFAAGLKDVETFSHLVVIYYCHRARPWRPLITTPWDTRPHGLFATRSPDRPNPLGLCVVELVERRATS